MSLSYVVDGETELDSALFNPIIDRVNGDAGPLANMRAGVANVLDYGAVGDGITDDTGAIQSALAAGPHVVLPAGVYAVTSVVVDTPGRSITLSPGAAVLAKGGGPPLRVTAGDVHIQGNGGVIDLGGVNDQGVYVAGTADAHLHAPVVRDLVITNRSVVTAHRAGVEIRYTDDALIDNVVVTEYGTGNTVGQEVYAFGFFYSDRLKFTNTRAVNAYIGYLIQGCTDVEGSHWSAQGINDNGVYILSGSDRITLSHGVIDGAEEGAAISSPRVTFRDVSFRGATNHGISLRNADYAAILHCDFNGCVEAICDDDAGTASDHVRIQDCDFRGSSATIHHIFLRALQDALITGNTFEITDVTALQYLVRLNNALRCRVNGNLWDDTTGTKTALRLSHDSQWCEVSYNTFVKASTAISLFASGGNGPSHTRAIYNNYHADIGTSLSASGGLTDNLHVEYPS